MTVHLRPAYLQQLSILGTTMGSPRDFAALLRAVDQGSWTPVIDRTFDLADAGEAHARIRSGDHFGKIVIAVA